MNATHATVGVSSATAVAMMTTLLSGWNGLTSDKAAALAWLLVTALGALMALVAWWVQWKYPSAPTLPVEVDLPAVIPVAPPAARPLVVVPPPAPAEAIPHVPV